MKSLIKLFYCIVFWCGITFGQDVQLKRIDSILSLNIDKEDKFDSIKNVLSTVDSNKLRTALYKVSIRCYRKNLLKQALFFGKQNLDILSKESPLDSLSYRKSLYNIGYLYTFTNETKKGIGIFQDIIQHKRNDKYDGNAYYQIGYHHFKKRDFYKAKDFFLKANASYIKSLDKNGIYNSAAKFAAIANITSDKVLIDKAITLLQKLINENLILVEDLSDIYMVIGNLYNDEKHNDKPKESITNYLKALDIAKQQEYKSIIPKLYNNIGNIYLKYDLDKAYPYLTEGIKITNNPRRKASLMHNLAIYYYKKQNPSKAILLLQKSINYYLEKDENRPLNNISLQELEFAYYKTYILDALIFLIKYENETVKTEKELLTINKHIKIAENLVEYIRFEIDDQESRLFWQQQASELYQNAIKTAFLSNDTDKAFYFSEKNKALLLLEDITDKQLKENSKLPNSILHREALLKKNIYSLYDQFITNNKNQKDSIANQISASKIKYHNFLDSLKIYFPEYYNYKKPQSVLSLEQVKSSLTDNEVLLLYNLNDSQGFLLYIDKYKSKLYLLKDVNAILYNSNLIKTLISSPFETEQEKNKFYGLANQLYNDIFPFERPDAVLTDKKITIIPDNTLQNFPFEVLVPNNTLSTPYVVHLAEIYYAYSISFHRENQNIERKHTTEFIGFAPVDFSYDRLPSLKRSELEISNAEQIYPGKLFFYSDASKENFKARSKSSKIIHLSTHANATDSIAPWIGFSNEKMTLNELYSTRNNAELVILSACNTSLGKHNKGEGVMSLARGFFYAGANSVISSIWNVDDKAGQYITSQFYKELKKGKTKSEALRNAKLNYLDHHSLGESSPYYWASLILIGDPGIIQTAATNCTGLILSLIFVTMIIITFYFRIKKRRNF